MIIGVLTVSLHIPLCNSLVDSVLSHIMTAVENFENLQVLDTQKEMFP